MERMRARILLDTLDASGATAAVAPSGRHAERREAILDRIAAAQAALADPDLGGGARGSLLSELERLELEEAEIRQAMGREDPRYAALRQPALAGIEEARAALRADEALLAYQISAEEFGGSRLIVLTARDLAVHPLPEVAGLRREVRFFLGLLDARDGSERELASALGRDLVEPALDRLDATIRRLVLVPDDFLWRLPFDALRVGASGEPLGGRFETSIAPSATLLSRWRAGAPGPPRIPALSPADPVRPGEGSEAAASAAERQWALAEGLRLGRLPHARDEARGLVAALGRGSLLRLGVDASESFLKAARLREYGVVHLAAHALVDDARPARSAVLLAPGAPGEDGLLQAREIVGLDLSGRTVLLSACRSASGQVLSGEGPMSLAHAFFLAGARAVVGGLTPVRDDEAAAFVESLSRGIAAGEEVASALAAARLEKIRSGAPAAAWSSLVVLGDGALRPLPRALAAPSAPASATAVLIGLAALALGAALVSWLRRRLRAGVS
jgi:CHAT domain-containing protein